MTSNKMSYNRTSNSGIVSIWLLFGILAGIGLFLLGWAACYRLYVSPVQGRLQSQIDSLQQWDALNRQERKDIANIQSMNTSQLEEWIARNNEVTAHLQELMQELKDTESSAAREPFFYLITIVIAAAAVGFFTWLIIHDANAEAARTMQNAMAVLPALRESLSCTSQTQLPLIESERVD